MTALPVRCGPYFSHAREWINRQCMVSGLGGFGAIVAALVIFSPLIDGGTTQLPVFIIRMVLLISGVVWLFGRMKVGEVFLPQSRVDLCVALFAGWAIVSLAWSPYKNASVQWVLSMLSYVALFVIIAQGIRSHAEIRMLVVLVTGMGMLEGLTGLAQYLWMEDTRARGTFFNPNFFAAYEAAVFLLSLSLLLLSKKEWYSVWFRRWLWCASAVSFAAVVTAQSRGASAALMGASLLLGFSQYGKKALAVVSLCVLAALFLPNPLQHRIAHVTEDPYAYTRLDIWKSSVVRVLEHPLGIGVGMFKQGSFQERFPIEGNIVRYGKRPESAHNEYLQMGVELGLVGLVIFFCGAALWAAEIRRLCHEPADTIDRGLLMGLTVSSVVLLLHAAVDSTFHEPALMLVLILMGGLVHNRYLRHRPDALTWRRIAIPYHPFRAAYVIACAVIVAGLCAQSAAAWYLHEEGKRHGAQEDLEGALTWFIRAADVDPGTTGYHDSIARTAMQLYDASGRSDWLLKAAEEEAVARKLNPADGRFAYRSGTVYRLMSSQTLAGAQRADLLSQAAEAYAEAIRLDPYSPFGYFELAQLRLAEGRVEEALALLTTATAHEPNFLPGRALLAEQSLRTGIPGDYQREYAAIKAVVSKYADRKLNETERRFLDVDLYPLGRAIAMEAMP